MTLTETRPEADTAAAEPEPVVAAPETWLTTSDHKKLGILFLGFSMLFLLVGGVLALVLRGQLAEGDVVGGQYGRLFNMHATVMTMLFLAPAWTGLATYVVPLQIGAGRLALPRLHALALWLYVAGGGVLVAAYVDGTPAGLGLTQSVPPVAQGKADTATLLWIAGLVLLAAATMLAAASLLTTVLLLRTEGMTLRRTPAFSWAVLVTSAVLLLSTPVFLAGLTILFFDQKYGGTFFAATGSQIVWQHTLWLVGRPEIYLLTLPGLGAACDIVTTHLRKPLLSHDAALGLIGLFGALTITAWAAGVHSATAVVLPTYTVLTALMAVPIAGLVLLWLGTARIGRPRLDVSLLFVVGFILLLVTGAANVVGAAVKGFDGPNSWTTANLHTVAFGAPALLVFGGLYHWVPKMGGRRLSQGLGGLVFVLLFGGFFVNGMAGYILGYQGAPNHVDDLGADKFQSMARVAAAGGVLVAIGVLVFLFDVVKNVLLRKGSEAGDDPYDGLTLEWATTSPPPVHGFDTVPEVRSPAPLDDRRTLSTQGATR